MNIQLGNLELKDVVEEEALEKVKTYLEANGYRREVTCDKIKTAEGNYHIFDMPRLITICGEQKMQDFLKYLRENNLTGAFKGRVGVTYCDFVPC